MPKDDQKCEAARNQVLASLSDAEKEKFHKLEELIKNTGDDLTLHRAVGKFVTDSGLLKKVNMRMLSWACGFASDSSLGKKVRLAKDFTADKIKQLQAWGVPLGAVQDTVKLRDAEKRWAILKDAGANHWTAADVRRLLKSTVDSPHPYGGRPRKKLQSHGPEVDLEELVGLTTTWLEHFNVLGKNLQKRKELFALLKKAAAALGKFRDAAQS